MDKLARTNAKNTLIHIAKTLDVSQADLAYMIDASPATIKNLILRDQIPQESLAYKIFELHGKVVTTHPQQFKKVNAVAVKHA